jgi:MSHA biogenesis protein MshI
MLGGVNDSRWTAVHFHPDRVDVARVARNSGRPKVELCATFPSQGNEAAVLVELRRRLHLERAHCTTLLAPGDYQLQLLEAPNVPAEEVKAAARWKLKDYLDYPVDAATVDAVAVPTDPNATTRARSLYAVASPNDKVAACMKLFAEARVPLTAIDIPEMAQRNLAALFEAERRALALLSFASQRGLLTFSSGGELYVARTIDVGLEHLVSAQGDLKAQLFERIVLEVQRSLDHFDRQFSFVPVSRLLIAALPEEVGLDSYLSQNLYVPVEVARLDSVLDLDAVPDLASPQAQTQHFMVLGAALRDEAPR